MDGHGFGKEDTYWKAQEETNSQDLRTGKPWGVKEQGSGWHGWLTRGGSICDPGRGSGGGVGSWVAMMSWLWSDFMMLTVQANGRREGLRP